MLRNPGLRKSVEQPVLDLNFAASQIGSNGAPDSRIDFSRGTNAWFVDSDGLVKKSPHNLIKESETFVHGASGWLRAGTTLEASLESPDGIDGSTKLTWTGTGVFYNVVSVVAGQKYRFSYYVKLGTKPDNRYAVFDQTNSAFVITSTVVTGASSSEWTRVYVEATAPSGCTQLRFYPDRVDTSDGTGTIFITGVQVSQHTTLPVGNPYIKTAGSAVYAARLDHDPTWFMSAAQEQNLFEYSEMLDDSYWTKDFSGAIANQAADPNGETTAEKLVEDNTASSQHRAKTGVNVTNGLNYTYSLYAKASERSEIRLSFFSTNSAFANTFAQFDLSDGSISSSNTDDATITDVGDGWFRLTATEQATATAEARIVVQIVKDGNVSYDGEGTATPVAGDPGIFVWGLQFEVGSTASTYHRTTGAPYYGEGATPKGLLIEEQRANLLISSNDLTGDDGLSSSVSNTQNAALGPDGTVTAAKLAANTTSPSNPRVFYPASGITLGAGTYTYSIFLKKAEVSFVKVRIGVSGDFPGVFFNLTNGTVGTASSGFTGRIVDYGNGYFRCSVTATLSAAHYFAGVHLASADNTLLSSATVGDGVFMWGHSLELGSFPTSYIETTGSSATRNADVATMGPTTGGTELVTNGTFDTDVSNWVEFQANSSITFSSGAAIISSNQYNDVRQVLSLVEGRRYRASMDVITRTSGAWFFLLQHDSTLSFAQGSFPDGSTQTFDFTAGAVNTLRIYPYTTTNPDTIKVDNISVRELYPFEQFEQSQGTIVAEITHETVANPSSTYYPATLVFKEGGAAGNGIYFINVIGPAFSQDTTRYVYIKSDGANQVNGLGQKVDPGVPFVQALSYAANNVDHFVSGNVPSDGQSDNSCTLPHPDQIVFNNNSKGAYYIKRLTYFNRKVSDDTLQFLSDV